MYVAGIYGKITENDNFSEGQIGKILEGDCEAY